MRSSPHVPVRLIVVLMLGSASLFGQDAKLPAKSRSNYGKVRVGPVYLTPTLVVLAGVDNNVYNQPAGIPDESVTVTPGVRAVVPVTRHARLKAGGGVTPYYFHKEASERHTDVFGDVGAEIDLGPLTAFGSVGAGRFRDRFSLEIDERLLRRTRTNTAGGTVHLGRAITMTGSRTDIRTLFDPGAALDGESVSGALDRDTVTRHVDLSIPLTRKTSFVPWVDFVEDRFLRSTLEATAVVPSQRYAAALEFGELAFIKGRVAAGVRHYGTHDGVTPYSGLFLSVGAIAPFVLHTALQVTSTRDVTYGVTPAPEAPNIHSTYVASNHRAELLFELPWRLHGRGSFTYLEARYLLPPSADSSTTARRDHGITYGAILLRRFGRHLSLGGSGEWGERLSPLDGHSYQRTILAFTGEVHF
jgi:hypothetical protein